MAENKEEGWGIFVSKEKKQMTKLEILKKLSPGTSLRLGLNDILRGGHGALIVISNLNSLNIFEGGFKVNCKFTPQRLAELAKMDGAIILSDDFKKIIYANTLLIPDRTFTTSETGTRHQAAERVAKQIEGLVIAVSERRRKIKVYFGNSSYVLQNTEDLLRRATETLRILEKQREVFDELLSNLNVLEVTDLVSVADICSILQRVEMTKKMAQIINEYIVELGREGVLVRMRMREVTKDIEKNEEFIILDYVSRPIRARNFFKSLNFDDLLDTERISRVLFEGNSESKIIPKGYRLLSKVNLDNNEKTSLINFFKNLSNILNSDDEHLERILGEKTRKFKGEISELKEQIMIGKEI